MLQYDFEQSIGYWITLTSHMYQQALNAELAPYGITFRQFQVLGWLAYEGELSQTELAERMMIEPATLVGILDRMERSDWIERRPSAEDKRKKLIAVRPQAQPIWAQMVDCLKRMRQIATIGMTAEQISTLQQLLQIVQQNLGAHAANSSALTTDA